MEVPIISVIVPVYNVEPYLHQCIDSILTQTFTDYELILIDDGSPDNCGKICDTYVAADSRVVVIHQMNGGLSAARNAGMDIMRGEYVAFIDSDDVIAPNYLLELYHAINEHQAEISVCGMQTFSEEDIDFQDKNIPAVFYSLTGRDALISRYSGNLSITCWGKLIDRRLIENIRFPVGKIHEDQAIMPGIFYKSTSVSVTKAQLYFYRVRKGSITASTFSLKHFHNIEFMNQFIDYLRVVHDDEMIKLAKKHRDKTLAEYNILAKAQGLIVPKEYCMRNFKALMIFCHVNTYDRFIWYLNKLYPRCVRPYMYFRKITSIFTGKSL